MKIETHLSPNCSELCFAIRSLVHKDALSKIFLAMEKAGMEVCAELGYGGEQLQLPAPQMGALMAATEGKSFTQVDKLLLMDSLLKRTNIPEKKIQEIISGINSESDDRIHFTVDGLSLMTDDGLGTSGCPILMGSDSEEGDYETLYKASQLFEGEVYGHDGGHTIGYEEWVVKHETKGGKK